MAVGGNATFAAGYSIADQLTDIDLCNEDTLIVGCHLLSWPSGRNYFGNIAVGELQSNADELFRPILDTGCTIREEQDVLRFAEIHSGLMELSTAMSSWSQTIGDMRVVFGDLKFSYSGLFNIEVVTVTDPSFLMGKVKRIMLPDNHRASRLDAWQVP